MTQPRAGNSLIVWVTEKEIPLRLNFYEAKHRNNMKERFEAKGLKVFAPKSIEEISLAFKT